MTTLNFGIGGQRSPLAGHSATVRLLAVLLLLACRPAGPPDFSKVRNVEDARARLLATIPEGREIAGARAFLEERGFSCAEPLPSATTAHAIFCSASPRAPAYQRGWEITLIERNGRLMDVAARELR